MKIVKRIFVLILSLGVLLSALPCEKVSLFAEEEKPEYRWVSPLPGKKIKKVLTINSSLGYNGQRSVIVALTEDLEVYTWGYGSIYFEGEKDISTPKKILDNVKDISQEGWVFFAITESKDLYGWTFVKDSNTLEYSNPKKLLSGISNMKQLNAVYSDYSDEKYAMTDNHTLYFLKYDDEKGSWSEIHIKKLVEDVIKFDFGDGYLWLLTGTGELYRVRVEYFEDHGERETKLVESGVTDVIAEVYFTLMLKDNNIFITTSGISKTLAVENVKYIYKIFGGDEEYIYEDISGNMHRLKINENYGEVENDEIITDWPKGRAEENDDGSYTINGKQYIWNRNIKRFVEKTENEENEKDKIESEDGNLKKYKAGRLFQKIRKSGTDDEEEEEEWKLILENVGDYHWSYNSGGAAISDNKLYAWGAQYEKTIVDGEVVPNTETPKVICSNAKRLWEVGSFWDKSHKIQGASQLQLVISDTKDELRILLLKNLVVEPQKNESEDENTDNFERGTNNSTIISNGTVNNGSSKKITVKKTILMSVKKNGKKKLKVTWKKVKGVSGYEVAYAQKKSFSGKKIVKAKASATSVKLKKLKSKKKYYVRVRAYTKSGGKTYYGKWSKVKSCKVK